MEMTEHIYGIRKRRFPIAENLQNHLPNAIKIINATAILHNISVLWEEISVDQPDGRPPDPADKPALPAEPDVHVDFDPHSGSKAFFLGRPTPGRLTMEVTDM